MNQDPSPFTAPRAAPSSSPDLADPRWMPLSYEPGSDCFLFAPVDLDLLGRAAFLDQRLGEVWQRTVATPAIEIDAAAMPSAPAWLFHTAFCCSTLLARALHAPSDVVALKEPYALMAMAQMSLHEQSLPPGLLDIRLRDTVALLGRPWSARGRILIKPTNAVNRLLPRLIALTPSTRTVLLYGSLEDFLVSCCKKLPSAETPMRWMAQYLLPGSRLERALEIPAGYQLNFVESCVLTWYAQIERYAEALASDRQDRLRSLDMEALLDHPVAAVRACTRWLELGNADDEGVASRVQAVFSRDAKRTEASHGPDRRAAERAAVMAQHGELLRAALAWAEQFVAPNALQPADWKPLPLA